MRANSGRRSVIFLALLLVLAPLGTSTAHASTTVGGGVVSGTATCDADGLTVEADAAGFAYNTVIMGHVGDIQISGEGDAPCGSSTTLTMSVNGLGPTGSRLQCPSLTGTYTNTGTTVEIDVVGECRINNFPDEVRWEIDAVSGFAGTFSIESA